MMCRGLGEEPWFTDNGFNQQEEKSVNEDPRASLPLALKSDQRLRV